MEILNRKTLKDANVGMSNISISIAIKRQTIRLSKWATMFTKAKHGKYIHFVQIEADLFFYIDDNEDGFKLYVIESDKNSASARCADLTKALYDAYGLPDFKIYRVRETKTEYQEKKLFMVEIPDRFQRKFIYKRLNN